MRIFMLVQPREARGPVPRHTAHLVTALRSLGCTVVTHPWGRRSESPSLREIITSVAAANVRSARVLEKCGFQRVGSAFEVWERHDSPIELHVYRRDA